MLQLTSFLLSWVSEGEGGFLLWGLIIFLTTSVLYYFISWDIRCYIVSLYVTPCCSLLVRFYLYLESLQLLLIMRNSDLINSLHLIEGWSPSWNWGCNEVVGRSHWNRGITYLLVSFFIINWLCLESFWNCMFLRSHSNICKEKMVLLIFAIIIKTSEQQCSINFETKIQNAPLQSNFVDWVKHFLLFSVCILDIP